jgi:ankyrin repeat protein
MKTSLVERHSQDELDFALIAAAGRGRSEAARLLLAAGADPKRRVPPYGFSSVIVAIRENHSETLIVLLEHGGDPNETDRMGWRPLHHTTGPNYERPDAIRALVQHGAVVDSRDGLQRTALHRAAGFGHAESVRVLLAAGADPSLHDKHGYSAIQRAIIAGHREIAELIQSYLSRKPAKLSE